MLKKNYTYKNILATLLFVCMIFFVLNTLTYPPRLYNSGDFENNLSFSFENRIDIRQKFDDVSGKLIVFTPCLFDKIMSYISPFASHHFLACVFIPTLSLLLVILWNQDKDGKKRRFQSTIY